MRIITPEDTDSWNPVLFNGCKVKLKNDKRWKKFRTVVSMGFVSTGSVVTLSVKRGKSKKYSFCVHTGKELSRLFNDGRLKVKVPIGDWYGVDVDRMRLQDGGICMANNVVSKRCLA